jgi:hypothetical protein
MTGTDPIRTLRRELERSLYALGDHDEPTKEALVSLEQVERERHGHRICEENMDAEIARLREALERVAYYSGCYTHKQRRDIARAALEPFGTTDNPEEES